MEASKAAAHRNPDTLTDSLTKNLRIIKESWDNSADLIITPFLLGGISCAMLSCEGMVSSAMLSQLVLQPIHQLRRDFSDANSLLSYLSTNLILSPDRTRLREFPKLFHHVSGGFVILLIDGASEALAVAVQGFLSRTIMPPDGEQNLYGAKEGFTENLPTNLSLLRRRMKSPLLTMQMCTAGTLSATSLCICYLQDRVSKSLVASVRRRLETLPLETILSSDYVRAFLEEDHHHLFHTVGTTERPDVLCAKLLEGRIAVLIDGTPFALTLPQLFWEQFQTLDDYNVPTVYASLLRLLKYAAFLMALFFPSVYLAIAVWHPELLNQTLLQILSDSEQSAPFSLTSELLGVLFMFEVVREAGIRLPKAVGGAVSIVGGLIIGDAAVRSGLVSTPVLTVAALSVTAGFVLPELHSVMTLIRPLLVLLASACGLSGIAVGAMVILLNLCAAEIYRFPVTAPLAPLSLRRLRDVLIRIGFRPLSQGNFHVSEVRQTHDQNHI